MPDPKQTTTQPDPKAPPADAKPSHLIPMAKLTARPGETFPAPGKAATSSLQAGAPTTSGYYTIDLDPRIRHYVISHYEPGAKLDRKPAATLIVPETWASGTPRVPA